MKRFMIVVATATVAAGGVAIPATASAAAAHHHKHHARANNIQRHPCEGLGIDLALGSINICVPL
ncbi:MAG TPA: hypothetical protein VHE57_01420 [Mycobacteriales bacterium]|nr:hypothetical protein [Mycobacteriales bacterium]